MRPVALPFGVCDITLQGMKRELRAANVVRSDVIDVDMVNCQPALVADICRGTVPLVEEYCGDRKGTLKKVMRAYDCNRDAAKNAFISSMFARKFDLARWKEKNGITPENEKADAYIVAYNKQMEQARDAMLVAYPIFNKIHQATHGGIPKKVNNPKGRAFSLLVQSLEAALLEKMRFAL